MRARLFVTEALRSVTANLSTTVAAIMSVLVGMFLFGLFIALGSWVLSLTNDVKKGLIVNVYFCTTLPPCNREATTGEINAVRLKLQQMPEVKSVTFVSKQDALRIMREKNPELTQNLTSNPFPPSFEITPKRAEDVRKIAARLQPLPTGVEKVNYGEKKADRVLQVAKIIGFVFLIGSVILLVASVLLISNTIRLSIFSRRREIEVMKLVGATNWFVRGPFMLEGLICGLVGSLAAVLLLLLAKELALPAIPALEGADDDVRAWSFPAIALILIATSLLIGAAGSGITLRRFLRI